MRWCRLRALLAALFTTTLCLACGPIVTVGGSGGAGGTAGTGATTGAGAQGGTTSDTGGSTLSTSGISTITDTPDPPCVVPATDCPDPLPPCQVWACDDNGLCIALADADHPLPPPQQIAGDCQSKACQSGMLVDVEDDADVQDDQNVCTADFCTFGLPMHTPMPFGAPCGMGNEYCDGNGICMNCLDLVCQAGYHCDPVEITCVPDESCMDGIQNGSETDIDCGGPDCVPCSAGQTCIVSADCKSGSCTANHCQ